MIEVRVETPRSRGEPLLEVRDLVTVFPTAEGVITPAHGVSLKVRTGEALGLVGESGSGKSIFCRSLLGLVPKPGRVIDGDVILGGRNLLRLSERELRSVRAHEIGMIFQDATSSLNPVYRVGNQIKETLRVNLGLGRREANARAIQLLDRVGIPSPERRFYAYPHELSGGMRQRIMIALAIAPRPSLLLADEPTTSLDVTIQEQILFLLSSLQVETGMALILVSHDFGIVAQTCDSVAVMYSGYVVEYGPVEEILARPQHPYTQGLVASIPRLHPLDRADPLQAITGQPPDLASLPHGCPFARRCPHVRETCADVSMKLETVDGAARGLTACPYVRSGGSIPA
jgi:oligopeptide/dipeptide ABC transporter ATP-binding protein